MWAGHSVTGTCARALKSDLRDSDVLGQLEVSIGFADSHACHGVPSPHSPAKTCRSESNESGDLRTAR